MSRLLVLLVAAGAAGASVWLRGLPTGRVRVLAGRELGVPGWLAGDRPVRAGRVSGPGRGAAAGTGARWWRAVHQRLRPGPPAPVAELLAGLVAELAAGQPTALALESAAVGLTPDPCPRARRAARMGGDVPAALNVDAAAPGAAGLRGLAACWQVAEGSGAGLALAVERLADGLRASQEARAQLEAEVAGVRSTARLLALLPALGLVVGHGMGADPVGWLTGSWPGRAVLAGGLALQIAGLLWLRRIIASVREVL